MKPLLCLLFALPALAAVTNVRTSPTPTQIIVSYTAPDFAACTLEASESAGYSPLVHDVDTTLFTGANLDSRSGNITRGRARVFVLGKRIAEPGSDSVNYSRALQHSTKHYIRITCGGDQATVTETTATIPWGSSFPDITPAVWPDLSWSNRNDRVIDPLTGTLIKWLSLPIAEWHINYTLQDWAFSAAYGSAWTSPGNITSDDSSFATFTGTGSDVMYMRNAITFPSDLFVIDDISLYFKGRVANGATGEDKKIQVALTIDGANPYGAWREATLQTVTEYAGGATLQEVGTRSAPVPVMGGWLSAGQQPPRMDDITTRSGSVSTSGSTATFIYNSGSTFNTRWGAGSRITINGSEYTIASIQSGLGLTTTTSIGTNASVGYSAPNFGLLVRKKTSSTHLVEIQYAKLLMYVSFRPQWNGGSGSSQMCAPRTRNDSSGKAGYHCAYVGGAGDLLAFWIAPSDGEVRYLGPVWTESPGNWNTQICAAQQISWDVSDPTYDAIWCMVSDVTATKALLVKLSYTGSNDTDVGQQISQGSAGVRAAWTGVSVLGATSFSTLMPAFDADYEVSKFGTPSPVGMQDGKVQLHALQGSQDTPGWTVIFDPAVNQIVAARPSWKYQPSRWCGLHTSLTFTDAAWINTQGTGISGVGGIGPYLITTTGTMSSTPGACATNVLGVTGNHCTDVTVAGEPLGPAPQTSLQNAAPGDIFVFPGEIMRLLAKSGLTWTFQRGYGEDGVTAAHSSGVTAQAQCSAIPWQYLPTGGGLGPTWWWDYANDPHGYNTADPYGLRNTGAGALADFAFPDSHPDFRMGVYIYDGSDTTKDATWCPTSQASSMYGVRRAAWPDHVRNTDTWCLQSNPPFSGAYGTGYGEALEHHISYAQNDPAAHASARQWFADARPQNINQDLALTASLVSGQLYRVTAYDPGGAKNHKKMPLLVWPGKYNVATDISSAATGDVIGTTSADSYKYCLALNANECRTGSSAGDVYVNAPYVAPAPSGWVVTPGQYVCYNKVVLSEIGDPCVTVAPPHSDSAVQYLLTDRNEQTGIASRVITKGLHKPRTTNFLWNVRPLPDGSWMMIDAIPQGVRPEILLAKLPPPTATLPSVNRTDFLPVPVSVNPPAGLSVHNAIVEFGYNTSFHCMTRAEACVSNSSTGKWDATNPYYWSHEAPAGVSCSSGCTVYIPAIASRVLYYRVKYRDASNVVLATSGTEAVAVQ